MTLTELAERAEKEVYKIIKKILNFSLCSLRALRDIYFGCGSAALCPLWLI